MTAAVKNNLLIGAAAAGVLYCIHRKKSSVHGIGIVEDKHFDFVRVISKDGKHAVELNVHYYPGFDYLEARSYVRAGSRGGEWIYDDVIGEWEIKNGNELKRAIGAIKKYWHAFGIKYNEKDFENL